jgi:MSHA biogenesis protein MshI
LYIEADAVSLALAERNAESEPFTLLACDSVPVDNPKKLAKSLATLARRYQLTGMPTQLILEPDYYRLIQVDQPKVAERELPAAVKWLVKDLIDFPVSEAAIDVFPMPARSGSQNKCNVVVAKAADIANIQLAATQAGLELVGMGIAELALNALLSRLASAEYGVAIVVLQPSAHLFSVSLDGELYYSRQLSADYGESIVGNEDLLDKLGLEIQRSLDHYQSQARQPAPGNIVLINLGEDDEHLLEALNSRLAGALSLLDFSELLVLPDEIDQMALSQYTLALAGLYLRGSDDAAS